MKKTVQPIMDALFAKLLIYAFGEPFLSRMVCVTTPVLFQKVKIDGQIMFIALCREMHVSTFYLFGPNVSEEERISKKMAIFVAYAGKVEGFMPKEIFKNRIYFDVVGKVDAEEHQTFLHALVTIMTQLDILIRNFGLPKETKLSLKETPRLPPIPGALPKDIKTVFLNISL